MKRYKIVMCSGATYEVSSAPAKIDELRYCIEEEVVKVISFGDSRLMIVSDAVESIVELLDLN